MFAHFFKDLQIEHASIDKNPTRDIKVNSGCMFCPILCGICGLLFCLWVAKCSAL